MLALIHLKGLDPNPPPPPPAPPAPPEATVHDVFSKGYAPPKRKVFLGAPYMPAWVAKSFRNSSEHIIHKTHKPLKTIQDPPTDPPLEVSDPDKK